jgi:hypothetical protein
VPWLKKHRLRHGEQKRLAAQIGTSVRTLRRWSDLGDEDARPGRPAHTSKERERARAAIEPVWRELPAGHDGWRTVCACLRRAGIEVAVRLVQELVRELKEERAERERARIEARREHVEVHVRDAVWGLDEAHLGQDEEGDARALLVREHCVPCTLGLSVGGPVRGADVLRLLAVTAASRGGWPLVLMLDNGAANREARVQARLAAERVTVLWNLPRTPEHNARTERGIGDLKRASGLAGPAARWADATQGQVLRSQPGVPRTRMALCERLASAWWTLDACTPRWALGGWTPLELDSLAMRADDLVCRARFYEDVREELERIALGNANARARRMAERDAIWRALQRYGLVTRTRGGRLVPAFKADRIS